MNTFNHVFQTDNPDLHVADNADGDEEDEQTVKVRHVIPTEADFVYLGSEMPGMCTNVVYNQFKISFKTSFIKLKASKICKVLISAYMET